MAVQALGCGLEWDMARRRSSMRACSGQLENGKKVFAGFSAKHVPIFIYLNLPGSQPITLNPKTLKPQNPKTLKP